MFILIDIIITAAIIITAVITIIIVIITATVGNIITIIFIIIAVIITIIFIIIMITIINTIANMRQKTHPYKGTAMERKLHSFFVLSLPSHLMVFILSSKIL